MAQWSLLTVIVTLASWPHGVLAGKPDAARMFSNFVTLTGFTAIAESTNKANNTELSWTNWGVEALVTHLQSEAVVTALQNVTGEGFNVSSFADGCRTNGIDGAALNIILSDKSPCSQFHVLVPELKYGDCLKLASALTQILKSKADKSATPKEPRPWYRPFEREFKNVGMWILCPPALFCFILDRYYAFIDSRRAARKKEWLGAKKRRQEEKDKAKTQQQPEQLETEAVNDVEQKEHARSRRQTAVEGQSE